MFFTIALVSEMNTDQGTMCNLSAFRAALLISLGAFTYFLLLVYYPEIQRSVSLGLSVNASFAAEKGDYILIMLLLHLIE